MLLFTCQQANPSLHPVRIASSMYEVIRKGAESQCCVISGETCSGKTEIGKKVLNGLLQLVKAEKRDIASRVAWVRFGTNSLIHSCKFYQHRTISSLLKQAKLQHRMMF